VQSSAILTWPGRRLSVIICWFSSSLHLNGMEEIRPLFSEEKIGSRFHGNAND
jgi:hypothetical protein